MEFFNTHRADNICHYADKIAEIILFLYCIYLFSCVFSIFGTNCPYLS